MRTIIFCILFLYLNNFKAQSSFRIFYKVDSKQNRDNDSVRSDIYIVNAYPNQKLSLFYNNVYYNSDSIMTNLKNISDATGGVNIDFDKLGSVNWNKGVLTKNNEMYMIENFDGDSYKYIDNTAINWKISTYKKKCGEYDCQKATADYKGRQWEAWFVNDMPINVFPYRFSGLPGLIYEINDSTNSYHFTFLGLKKIKDDPFYPKIFSTAILTTKNKYSKAFSNYKNDPSKKLREGKLVTDSGETMIIFGGFSKNFIEEKVKATKTRLALINNPIELE